MAARCVTVVLTAMMLAVLAAVAVSAIKPERADAVPNRMIKACGGGTLALEYNENRIVHLHNQLRRDHGLEPLCVHPTLTEAARGHSADMIAGNYFGHGSVGTRLSSYGYNWVTFGENIAGGSGGYLSSPDNIFQMWLNSPGHYANIMNASFQEIGVGTATGEYNGSPYYTMYTVDFGVSR